MRSFSWICLALAVTVITVPLPGAAEAAATLADRAPPWGIAHGDEFWKPKPGSFDVGAVVERVEHAFRAGPDGIEAKSARYRASIDAHGTRLRFGPAALRFSTRAVRSQDAVLARASKEPWVAVGNTAQRRLAGSSGIVEHVEARAEGVESSWILTRRPRAPELTIDVSLAGMDFDEAVEAGHRLVAGAARLRIGHAVAVDSSGRRWKLESSVQARTLQVRVPDDVLASATYPLAIDPVFGPEVEISSDRAAMAPSDQEEPAIAAAHDLFYVTWQSREADPTLYGARVAVDGRVLDPGGVFLCGNCYQGDVAYLDGTFFATWISYPDGRLMGRRIDRDGVPTGGILPIGPSTGTTNSVSIAVGHDHLAVAHGHTPAVGPSVLRVELLNALGAWHHTLIFDDGGYEYFAQDIAATEEGWAIATAARAGTSAAIRYLEFDPDLNLGDDQWATSWSSTHLPENVAIAVQGSAKTIAWSEWDKAAKIHSIRATNEVGPGASSFLVEADTRAQLDVSAHRGSFWIAWSSADREVKVRPYSDVGVPKASETKVQASEGTPIFGGYTPALASNGSLLVVAWCDSRGADAEIFATRLLSSVVLDEPNILSSAADSAKWVQQREPAIASAEIRNHFLVVWSDTRNGEEDILATFVDENGYLLAPGGMNLSNSPGVRDLAPAVASDGERFFVAWQAIGGGVAASRIIGSRVDEPGPVGPALGNAPGVGYPISDDVPGSMAEAPAVAWNGSQWFVAWDDAPSVDRDILGRFLDADWHTNWLAPLLDLSQSSSAQKEVALTGVGSDVIAVWTDARPGTWDDYNLFATVVDPGGSVATPNEITAEDDDLFGPAEQSGAAIATDGGLAMVTYTVSTPGSPSDVRGLLLEQNYPAATFAFRSSTGKARSSAVAHSNGQYLIAWEDWDAGFPWLHYRVVQSDGTPSGFEWAHPTFRGTRPALAGLQDRWLSVYEAPVGGVPLVWGMTVAQ